MNLDSLMGPLSNLQDGRVSEIGPGPFLLIMTVSLACGFFVAFLYRFFYARRETGSQIHRSFPLLAVSITAIFICIQFSLPLSLGLLGALSIVRFRTPIKEPEEIGFLMVVIATSLACATFQFVFLAILLSLVLVAVAVRGWVPSLLGSATRHGLLLLAVPKDLWRAEREDLLAKLTAFLPKGRIESLTQLDDEVAVTYSFRNLAPERLTALEGELLREMPDLSLTLSYDRPGAP
ncbi:MAG: DUF4956 domain-containing protein [Acidobacteriota bacterium]